ncbi:response regulator transcription factor [Fulvivirga sediminis]|uniref:Response regulator transcription factor n=1 Tax=Fulvivirga sediminis TaxID=2803949 RepID=A0A937F7X3_9BACT|nr:response regulator transcription factor [Fulvivirga sediminis]MBL3655950.1 response regulator transcription factor [Fulvivirga sediminis]
MKDKNQHRILLVDDDKDILDLLKYNLQKEGYDVEVEKKSTKSIETATKFHPDLIVLDIMMPKVNGIEICRQLREMPDFKNTYIFFLTAKGDKLLQTQALDTGGDDYIEKITGLRALTHKISTVLKNNLVIRKSIKEITYGDFRIERSSHKVYFNNKVVELPRYEFELLYFFAQNPHKTITQDSLLNNIWGSDIYIFSKSVDTYIASIGKKLGKKFIAKVSENQYKFELR